MALVSALMEIWRRAHGIVVRRGVPVDEAEELVQEAFLKLYRYEQGQGQEAQSREAFVVTTVGNLIIDRARTARRRNTEAADPGDFDLLAADAPGQDEEVSSRQRLARLEAGFAQLPERTRRVLLSRRLDGLSFKEIAERERLTVSAIEKQVARATLLLMKWMDG